MLLENLYTSGSSSYKLFIIRYICPTTVKYISLGFCLTTVLFLLFTNVQGTYNIVVQSTGGIGRTTKTFKIEDYVLPRYEVTIKPPKYLLADAKILRIEVCAE